MEKTFTFYTDNDGGGKDLLHKIKVATRNPRDLFKQAVSMLKGKSRDVSDFLHIRGKHLYFWDRKVTWEVV